MTSVYSRRNKRYSRWSDCTRVKHATDDKSQRASPVQYVLITCRPSHYELYILRA